MNAPVAVERVYNDRDEQIGAGVEETLKTLRKTYRGAVFTQDQLRGALDLLKAATAKHDPYKVEIQDLLNHAAILELHNPKAQPQLEAAPPDKQAELEPKLKLLVTKTTREHEIAADTAADQLHARTSLKLPEELLAKVASDWKLTAEQENAFRHAVNGEDLAIITGRAGTGKSFVAGAIRDAYERYARDYTHDDPNIASLDVVGSGPTNVVAQNFLKGGGFTSRETVQALNLRGDLSNTVIILDEGMMVDSEEYSKLLPQAVKSGAKVIVIGDEKQFSSINPGGMFEVFQGKYNPAKLTETHRQKNPWHKEIVEAIGNSTPENVTEVFTKALDELNTREHVTWIKPNRKYPEKQWDATYKKIAKDWEASLSEGMTAESLFVVAHTNRHSDAINERLYRNHVKKNSLSGQEMEITTQLGDEEEGEAKSRPLKVAPGTRIQLLGTLKDKELYNGSFGTIEELSTVTKTRDAFEGEAGTDARALKSQTYTAQRLKVRFDDGRTVTFDTDEFNKLQYGYAGTTFKAQGKTCAKTFWLVDERWDTSRSAYIALSRPEHGVEVYVSGRTGTEKDIIEIGKAVSKQEDKPASITYVTAAERLAQIAQHLHAPDEMERDAPAIVPPAPHREPPASEITVTPEPVNATGNERHFAPLEMQWESDAPVHPAPAVEHGTTSWLDEVTKVMEDVSRPAAESSTANSQQQHGIEEQSAKVEKVEAAAMDLDQPVDWDFAQTRGGYPSRDSSRSPSVRSLLNDANAHASPTLPPTVLQPEVDKLMTQLETLALDPPGGHDSGHSKQSLEEAAAHDWANVVSLFDGQAGLASSSQDKDIHTVALEGKASFVEKIEARRSAVDPAAIQLPQHEAAAEEAVPELKKSQSMDFSAEQQRQPRGTDRSSDRSRARSASAHAR